jgi:hypothetical protein
MIRRSLLLFALAAVGCVPVTEPVGDITKAEPDKNLVGTWGNPGGKDELKFDAPVVKGNPKGLMRWTFTESKNEEPIWFFVATVGKEKYGNMCLSTDDSPKGALDFAKEGAYEKWAKTKTRAYVVFHYTTGKDQISLNFGNEKAFKAVAEEAKLTKVKNTEVYDTPAGWLDKYLDKNGRDKVFPNGDAKTFTRAK